MNEIEKLNREYEKLNEEKHHQLIRIKAEASWIVRQYEADKFKSTDLANCVSRFKDALNKIEDLDSKIDAVLEDKTKMLAKRKS